MLTKEYRIKNKDNKKLYNLLNKDRIKEQGKEYADNRKKLYRIRHKKDLNTTRGKLSNLILWS